MSQIIFTEQKIINAVKYFLTDEVNNYLQKLDFQIPIIEFGIFRGIDVVVPSISLSSCEQTEKERIVKENSYTVIITFQIPETIESELFCYAYADAVDKALNEDVTLGGVADRSEITNKKYLPPKKSDCGLDWELSLTLRIIFEGLNQTGDMQ